MQCPGDWENGFKEGRVMRFGDGERRLSDMRSGDWQGATFSLEISDFDRSIRERLASPELRYWSDPLVIKMTDRATRAAKGNPYVVFVGPIIDAKVTGPSGMGWDLTLGDVVSQGLLSDQAQAPWRRIGDGFLSKLTQVAEGLDLDTPEPIIYGRHKRLSTDGPSGEGLVYKPTYLGIIDGNTHVWMIAGHACADVPMVYVDEAPSSDFSPNTSIDFQSDTFGNQRRYTLLYAPVTDPTFLDPEAEAPAPEDVTDPDACARDQKQLAVYVEGVEPNGDGSGAVITDRLRQYKHFTINFIANQGQDSYQSGPWLDNPTWSIFDVDVPAVDEDTYDEARAISLIRFPGDGYTGAWIIGAKSGDRKTLLEWIAGWNRSCSVRFGFNHLGQMQIFMLHPTQAVKDAAPLIDDVNVILKDSFSPQVLWDRRANRIPFLYDYNHTTGQWMGVGNEPDWTSINGYGKTYTGETREYPAAPGITNASHLATIELWQTRFPSWRVTAQSALLPLGMMDLGQYVRYRHFASIGSSASQIRLGYIERHQVQAGKRRVEVDLLDVEDLIGFDTPGEGPAGELNDRCSTAWEFVYVEPAEGQSYWQRFTESTGAHTQDVSITALVSPNSDKKPAWFKFTAPSDGNLSVITSTTAYDDYLYFLDGTCGDDDWSVLNENDNFVELAAGAAIDMTAGQTVYILIVGKTDDASGFLLAQASFAPAP